MAKRDIGLLFIHGIVGNSEIFRFIKDAVPHGLSCECLTLQGHGGDALGFSRASMQAWEKQVAEAAARMRSRFDKVIVVAHSMGCLLALESAVRPHVDAYLLLNPPLRLRIRFRMISNSVKVALGLTDGDEAATAAKEAYGITLDKNPFHYYGWPARYMELFKKICQTRNQLKNSSLDCPVEVFLAEHDEMVSTRSADAFRTAGHEVPRTSESACNITILPSSGHYYYPDSDRLLICQGLNRLLHATSL